MIFWSQIIDAARRIRSGAVSGTSAELRLSFASYLHFFAKAMGKPGRVILATFINLLVISAAMGANYIDNTAKADYFSGAAPITTYSNLVSKLVCTQAKIEFLKYAPSYANAESVKVQPTDYLDATGTFRPMPPPVVLGSSTPLDISSPVNLAPVNSLNTANAYHVGETIFISIQDADQNLDKTKPESLQITIELQGSSEQETLILSETGADTGIFVGYINSTDADPVMNNGQFSVFKNSNIIAKYLDRCGTSGSGYDSTLEALALVDPYGIVFDSSNGTPVNGAIITLINTDTNSPATVFGDDGLSPFPATVISGATLVVNGIAYTVPPGGYRYPYVMPGNYQFEIKPPAGYSAPTTISDDSLLQNLPNGPFTIVTPGSRLEPFTINPGPAVHIDIPLDPSNSSFWLRKTADRDIVAIGDFLQYQLELQNNQSATVATGVTINDTLPLGLRYKSGSTRLNGKKSAEPDISADGRTLTFSLGDLAPKTDVSIRYVVEVSAGAKQGIATNRAIARSTNNIISRLAEYSVRIRSDFMSNRSIIMGEMILGPCETPIDKTQFDLSGFRILLEDGTFALTDKYGMYHFEGVKPGTRVVQLDLDSIPRQYELQSCDENSRFAGRSYSQFVDMQGGMLWRADFYFGLKPKITGEVGLELLSAVRPEPSSSEDAETVEYRVPIQIGSVPVGKLRLSVMLADDLTYQPGTSTLNNSPLSDPAVMNGVLTYSLGDLPENWSGTVQFKTSVPRSGKAGRLTTSALLTFDTPEKNNVRTPLVDNILERRQTGFAPAQPAPPQERTAKQVAMPEIILHPHFPTFGAELSDADRQMIDNLTRHLAGLDIEEVTVTGHTDNVRIAPRSRRIYPDNNALSKARAESVGRFLTKSLHLPADKFRYFGKGMTEPVADNRSDEGKASNRRVEVKIRTVKSVEIPPTEPSSTAPTPVIASEVVNEKERSGVKSVPVVGLRPGEKWQESKADQALGITSAEANHWINLRNMPEFNNKWFDANKPGFAWIWPTEGYYPTIPSLKLAIKHDPAKNLKLFLNGTEVDPITFDSTVKSSDNLTAVSIWYGVGLQEGDSVFDAVEYQNGVESSRIRHIVHYSGTPVHAEFAPDKSRLAADGKTPPVIAIRLTDKNGHPARVGLIGEFAINSPYEPLSINSSLNSPAERLKYELGEDGIARIKLKPTTMAGEAKVQLNLVSGKQEITARLVPDYRDWVLVGLAEGTVGYNTVSGNMESLHASNDDENFYDSERIAFYAKGTIKGEWLLTAAYDSKKERTGVTGNGLFQTIDPNTYYTIYGDGSSQMYDAASQSKLYVKIERDQFYALYGDYDTGLTVTELTRYSRRMNGIKSEYRSKNYDLRVFGSETAQSFVKDELRGDGTSGLYRLSRKGIVLNSDKITIESRDRFQSEIITNSVQLSRFIDYSIDYDTGAIFFKSPVASRDDKLNPVYIVIDYEILNSGTESFTYGGRAATRVLNGKAEVGASYVREGQVSGDNQMYGVDATAILAPGTKARAEFATTDNEVGVNQTGNAYKSSTTNNNGIKQKASAYLAEVIHTGKSFDGRLYYKEQEQGFGLSQQSGSESGTRKFGAETGYRLNEKVTLKGQAYRQYNLADDGVREFMEALASYNEKQYSLRSGIIYANDNLPDGSNTTSVLVNAGASWRTADQKLTLRADHDQALFSKDVNTDFPTRTIFGADYQVTKETAVFVQEELTFGAAENTNTTRAGVKTIPWSGGTLNSSVVNDMRENSDRTFANVGMTQKWQVNPEWAVDGALDHSKTIREKTGYSMNSNVAPASGGDNFTAVSLGANYTEKYLLWSNRVEYRNSDTDDKWGLLSGIIKEHGLDWAWTGRVQLFHTQSVGGNSSSTGDLRYGLVYRPPLTKWIVLNRLDLLYSDVKTAESSIVGKRLINNLNANYKPDKKTQISFQYGAKYVFEEIDDRNYSGYTDLIGFEGRYDINKEWDLGFRGSLLHTWSSEQYAYSFGPSIGYNVMENAWISLGYNFAGFEDKDFSAANYTADGPYIKFRFKFDQNSVKEGLKMMGQ